MNGWSYFSCPGPYCIDTGPGPVLVAKNFLGSSVTAVDVSLRACVLAYVQQFF